MFTAITVVLIALFYPRFQQKLNPGKGLFFKKGPSQEVEIYSDANWAGSATDRRFTSGYCTYVWDNLLLGEARNNQWSLGAVQK